MDSNGNTGTQILQVTAQNANHYTITHRDLDKSKIEDFGLGGLNWLCAYFYAF